MGCPKGGKPGIIVEDEKTGKNEEEERKISRKEEGRRKKVEGKDN